MVAKRFTNNVFLSTYARGWNRGDSIVAVSTRRVSNSSDSVSVEFSSSFVEEAATKMADRSS